MSYLDQQNAKPLQQKFLDFLPLKLQTKEEVHAALHKIPEMKLRPEKLSELDELHIEDILSWNKEQEYPYVDPVPPDMKQLDIRELSSVEIDWKMLTLTRPSTQHEINIFSRIVSLDKLMLKSITREKTKKEELNSVYLKESGRLKVERDNSYEKADEFSYDFYSRFYGANERGQTLDEIPKPATAEQKPEQNTQPEVPAVKEDENAEITPTQRNSRPKNKRRKKKKRKGSKKTKIRKRKMATEKEQTTKNKNGVKKIVPKKTSTVKKVISSTKTVKGKVKVKSKSAVKKTESKKTLVQMVKSVERREKKITERKKK